MFLPVHRGLAFCFPILPKEWKSFEIEETRISFLKCYISQSFNAFNLSKEAPSDERPQQVSPQATVSVPADVSDCLVDLPLLLLLHPGDLPGDLLGLPLHLLLDLVGHAVEVVAVAVVAEEAAAEAGVADRDELPPLAA